MEKEKRMDMNDLIRVLFLRIYKKSFCGKSKATFQQNYWKVGNFNKRTQNIITIF